MSEFASSEQLHELPPIPERCRGCGVQEYERRAAANLITERTITLLAAQCMVGDSGAEVDRKIEEQLPSDLSPQLKTGIRQNMAAKLDTLDNKIKQSHATLEELGDACDGLLTLCAVRRGVEYTAIICASRAPLNCSDWTPARVETRDA